MKRILLVLKQVAFHREIRKPPRSNKVSDPLGKALEHFLNPACNSPEEQYDVFCLSPTFKNLSLAPLTDKGFWKTMQLTGFQSLQEELRGGAERGPS